MRTYRATIIDTISRQRAGSFLFPADNIGDAREYAWRRARLEFAACDIRVTVREVVER